MLKKSCFCILVSFELLILAVLPWRALAYETKDGNINAVFGPYAYQADYRGPLSSPVLGGFGLLVYGDINPHSSLEVDLFHLNKTFYRSQSGDTVEEEREMLLVAMGYRRWFNSYFSAAMTFFSTYGMGDFRVVHNDDLPAVSTVETSARSTTLYGVELSMQLELWSIDELAVILDGRYSYYLTHQSHESADNYGGMLAIRYFIQGKQSKTEKAKESN